ncbi:coagulation factor IX-like [Homarus americanus]|uniref:coagulation factor IX-like n=1 Tax=Homarus americanus TaxID=6706 RepID=UPI001C46F6C2|nr:coagulation factor IX-like [Homarus americanus]
MAPVIMVLWLSVVLGCCSTTLAQALECGDLSPECPEWASRDLCKSDLLFMLRNCPLSCGVCEGNCWNFSPECQKWASKDLCRTDPQFMQNMCAVSCKACRVFIQQRSIGNPTFECGKPVTTTDSRRPKRSDGGMMRVTLSHENTTPNIPGIIKPASINTRTQEGDGRITVEDAFCGATPISDRFLLTAAHCVFDHGHVPQTVLLGERDFSTDNETNSKPATYEISRIVVHPDYISDSFVRYNDVALLETKEPIAFNDLVYPYCVSVQRPPTNTTVTGSGFGLVNESELPKHL